MNLLAIDTSSVACSVALQIGGATTERHEELPREHTRLLVPMIEALLKESSVELKDLDAIVLGNGPGSFIGMRIAASVAQGLAFGAGLNIVPVSSLAAIAAQVFSMHEAEFRRGDDGLPVELVPERLHGQGLIDELELCGTGCVAAGFGWQRYPELLAANKARFAELVDPWHPHARFLLPLGAAGLEKGNAVEPQDVLPAYLRQKVAEIPAGAVSA